MPTSVAGGALPRRILFTFNRFRSSLTSRIARDVAALPSKLFPTSLVMERGLHFSMVTGTHYGIKAPWPAAYESVCKGYDERGLSFTR